MPGEGFVRRYVGMRCWELYDSAHLLRGLHEKHLFRILRAPCFFPLRWVRDYENQSKHRIPFDN
jgi:hypothetical protein